jgi:hypothetical protein
MLSLLPLGILSPLTALAADGGAPAPAPSLPTVAVVGLHQPSLTPADQDRAIAALVKAIEAGGRFDARDLPQVAAAVRGRERVVLEEGLLKTARQSLSNGRTAAAQASWDEARGWLTAAVQDFERVLPGANTTDELWEAWILLGATWLQQETPDEAAARDAFGKAIALNPQRPADPAQFPPSVTDVHAALQQEQLAKAATVSFTGKGTLWVDGAERGALPAEVPGLVPGPHHAVARGDGLQSYARFDVPTAGPLDLPPGPPSLGQAADGPANRAAQTAALYTALGKRSDGLDYVLVGGVEGGVLHLQLFDSARGVFSKPVDLPFTDACDDEAVAAVPLLLPIISAAGTFTATAASPAPLSIAENVALARLLTQPPPAPVVIGPEPVPVGPDGGKKSKLPLVLGIVGGVVVAGGATTAAVLLSGPPPEPTGTVVVNF